MLISGANMLLINHTIELDVMGPLNPIFRTLQEDCQRFLHSVLSLNMEFSGVSGTIIRKRPSMAVATCLCRSRWQAGRAGSRRLGLAGHLPFRWYGGRVSHPRRGLHARLRAARRSGCRTPAPAARCRTVKLDSLPSAVSARTRGLAAAAAAAAAAPLRGRGPVEPGAIRRREQSGAHVPFGPPGRLSGATGP